MPRFAPLACIAVLALAACGSSSDDSADTTVAGGSTTIASDTTVAGGSTTIALEPTIAGNPDKPTVELPAELPTELVVTELRAGEGATAAVGDTVLVNYVGVRSEDGTEFDNSWDGNTPFEVSLGAGGVIAGWDEGLVGTQTGGQYQLDIPADLAYGDSPPGDPIEAGDALSFVIDVLAVVSPSEAADQPEVTIAPSSGATDVTTTDVEVGDGATAAAGDIVYVDLVAYDGTTAEQLDSSYGVGSPFQLVLSDEGALPGLVNGIIGMQVGGTRLITIPPDQAFGPEGNAEVGLPANTDLIVLIHLAAAYSAG